jgi:integrase
VDPATGKRQRHQEKLPCSVPAAKAKLRAREILAAALAGAFDPNREPARRLAGAFDEYVEWCKSNRPSAASKRKAAADRFVAALGDIPLDDVSPFHVERFKRDRLAGGAAAATVNRDLAVLSHFYGLAASWGWALETVARAVRAVPHLKEPPGRVRYLSDEEEKRILVELPTQVRNIVVCALLSGMRQAEVVLLRKDAVDLRARVITLTRTKSNKVRRVYINDPLAALLDAAMKASRGAHVFTNTRGEPYTTDGVRTMFRRAVEKAKVDNFRFHDLRHTTATRLRQHGVGIDAIAEVLGHTTLAMARRYAHLGADTLRSAMANLPPPCLPVTGDPAVGAPVELPGAGVGAAARVD